MNQSENIGELAVALNSFQGAVHGATKNATNPHLKNKYADLGSVWDAIREALVANDLAVVQLPRPGADGRLHLATKLMHKSGQWIESEIVMPLAKQDPQGYGSALTYARRYGLTAMLGIVQEDDDATAATQGSPARTERTPTAKASAPKAEPVTPAGGASVEDVKAAVKAAGLQNSDATSLAIAMFQGRKVSELDDIERARLIQEIGGHAVTAA